MALTVNEINRIMRELIEPHPFWDHHTRRRVGLRYGEPRIAVFEGGPRHGESMIVRTDEIVVPIFPRLQVGMRLPDEALPDGPMIIKQGRYRRVIWGEPTVNGEPAWFYEWEGPDD